VVWCGVCERYMMCARAFVCLSLCLTACLSSVWCIFWWESVVCVCVCFVILHVFMEAFEHIHSHTQLTDERTRLSPLGFPLSPLPLRTGDMEAPVSVSGILCLSLSHTHSHRNTAPHKHTPLHACDTSAIDRNCFAFLHSEGSGGCWGEGEGGFRDGRDYLVQSSVPAVFFGRWGGGYGHSEHIQGFILHVFAEALRHKRGGRGGRGGGAHRAHTETCSNACACTHSYVTNRHSFSQVSLKFRMSLYCI
jgi:hypothetical protein